MFPVGGNLIKGEGEYNNSVPTTFQWNKDKRSLSGAADESSPPHAVMLRVTCCQTALPRWVSGAEHQLLHSYTHPKSSGKKRVSNTSSTFDLGGHVRGQDLRQRTIQWWSDPFLPDECATHWSISQCFWFPHIRGGMKPLAVQFNWWHTALATGLRRMKSSSRYVVWLCSISKSSLRYQQVMFTDS